MAAAENASEQVSPASRREYEAPAGSSPQEALTTIRNAYEEIGVETGVWQFCWWTRRTQAVETVRWRHSQWYLFVRGLPVAEMSDSSGLTLPRLEPATLFKIALHAFIAPRALPCTDLPEES